MTPFPVRKRNRMQYYDYSSPGRYFVTFCTVDKKCLLGQVKSAEDLKDTSVLLTKAGEIVKRLIDSVPDDYQHVSVDKYVIMPNHVHMILSIYERGQTLSYIIGQIKRKASAEIGRPIWQRHFHDHIIRDENDFLETVKYIDNNPKKWSLDEYFTDHSSPIYLSI